VSEEKGALYVSSVAKEGPVTRHGMAKARGSFHYIGAHRSGPKTIEFDEDQITYIPAAEFVTFTREYSRAIRTGALKVRKFSEYAAQQAKHAKQLADEIAAEEKAAKDKEAADAKAKSEAQKAGAAAASSSPPTTTPAPQ
jgi:hypothetical protein